MKRFIHSEVYSETEAERACRMLREQKEDIQRREVDGIRYAQQKEEAERLRKEIRKLGQKPCA